MLDSDPSRWKELARRIQAADPGSEDEFVGIFYPHVMAMALGRLRGVEEAREAAQEALLDILQALRNGRLREPKKLPAFVSGTARNRINASLQRYLERRKTLSYDANRDLASDQDKNAWEPAIDEEARRALVRAALRKLKPVDRRILTFTLVEGLNPREIAVKLGMKPENVRNHKSRALNIIRKKIGKAIRKGGTQYS